MHVKEALVIALRSMSTGRLRTALTMLGVIVGVTAVIVLVGLGDGLRSGYNQSFGQLSSGITIGKTTVAIPGGNSARELTDSDVVALDKDRDPSVISTVVPLVNGTGNMRNGSRQYLANVIGSSAQDYLQIRNRQLEAGSLFTEEQYRAKARVVVLAPKLVNALFGGSDQAAIGSNVQIGRFTFRVIGVLSAAGDQDDIALMPLSAARTFLFGGSGIDNLTGIGVMATGTGQVAAAIDEVDAILDRQHQIKEPGARDYTTVALINQLEQTDRLLNLLTWFTVAVAGISLFVGALGLANIMLVTVTERTSEIGIRKAIGARRSAILKQFLIESVAIAGIGGLVGVVLGIGLTLIGHQLLPRFAPQYGPPEVSVDAVGIAFLVSLVIGLVAGIYPARRAAMMHPIDALRY